MYKKLKYKYLKVILGFVLISFGINFGFAQSVSFDVSPESKVLITGTSSLHDWQMEAPIGNCRIEISSSTQENVLNLENVVFQLQVDKLKSEHKQMDNNAYKALKSKEYPNIKFSTNKLQVLNLSVEGTENTVKGILEIAGVKREIELKLIAESKSESDLLFHFTFPIHMEDYTVEPPSFMFGAVTTGSDMLASFELNFNKLNQ